MQTTRMKFFGDAVRFDAAPRHVSRARDQDEEGELVAVLPAGKNYEAVQDGAGLHVHSGKDHLATFHTGKFDARESADGHVGIYRVAESANTFARHRPERVNDCAIPVRVSPGSSPPEEYTSLRAMNRLADKLRASGFWQGA